VEVVKGVMAQALWLLLVGAAIGAAPSPATALIIVFDDISDAQPVSVTIDGGACPVAGPIRCAITGETATLTLVAAPGTFAGAGVSQATVGLTEPVGTEFEVEPPLVLISDGIALQIARAALAETLTLSFASDPDTVTRLGQATLIDETGGFQNITGTFMDPSLPAAALAGANISIIVRSENPLPTPEPSTLAILSLSILSLIGLLRTAQSLSPVDCSRCTGHQARLNADGEET